MAFDTRDSPEDSASGAAGPSGGACLETIPQRGSAAARPRQAIFMPSDEDSFQRRLHSVARLTTGDGDPPRLSAGDVVAERYRIDGFMKAGGMGQVFRATQLSLHRQVALKWLLSASSQGACARFIDEARAAARIEHPNVIEVHDAGVHRGGYYLVMELLHGESLAERIRPDPGTGARPLSPGELVEIMIPVLRGLAAAHARGVIHRDLKPDNVFLCTTSDGVPSEPKLLDFGICKLLECDQARTPTCAGAVLGTIPYMPPEQVNDAGRVDHRADIYAAGVMMYEALCGHRPFRAATTPALMFAILEQAPAPLRSVAPEVPGALEAIVQRAMAKRADQRYPSVEALIEDLSAFARTALPLGSSAPREARPARQASARSPDAAPGRVARPEHAFPRDVSQPQQQRPRALNRPAKFAPFAGLALGVMALSGAPATQTVEPAQTKAPIEGASLPEAAVPRARADASADLCMAMPAASTAASMEGASTSTDSATHPRDDLLMQPSERQRPSSAPRRAAARSDAAPNPRVRSPALVPSPLALQKELVMSPLAGKF